MRAIIVSPTMDSAVGPLGAAMARGMDAGLVILMKPPVSTRDFEDVETYIGCVKMDRSKVVTLRWM